MHDLNAMPALLKSPVAVVCHDAGAANLIFAWLKQGCESGSWDHHAFHLVLQGPAETLWAHNPVPLPTFQLHHTLDAALKDSVCVLSGTGWASSLEHRAREMAHRMGIPSMAVVDHWVNYPERFERDGNKVLPTQIWVSDPEAFRIATSLFQGIEVLELPNVYLNQLVASIQPVPTDGQTLLYVLEPVRHDWGRGQAGEFQALDFFVQHLSKVVGHESVQIKLRPHPSEPMDKYHHWLKAHPSFDISLDSSVDLKEALAQAKWVVGVETYALVVANAAGRLTYSSMPPWAGRCQLPVKGLIHLQDLI